MEIKITIDGVECLCDSDQTILDVAKNNGFDYIAMGHIHSFYIEGAGRGYAAYSGCLEPRGYDETGEKGFVIVNTEILNRADSIAFAPYARRLAWQINLDVSDCADQSHHSTVLPNARKYSLYLLSL